MVTRLIRVVTCYEERRDPTHRLVRPLNNAVMRGQVSNQIHYYLPLQKTHGHKNGNGADLPSEFPPLNPHDPLIT